MGLSCGLCRLHPPPKTQTNHHPHHPKSLHTNTAPKKPLQRPHPTTPPPPTPPPTTTPNPQTTALTPQPPTPPPKTPFETPSIKPQTTPNSHLTQTTRPPPPPPPSPPPPPPHPPPPPPPPPPPTPPLSYFLRFRVDISCVGSSASDTPGRLLGGSSPKFRVFFLRFFSPPEICCAAQAPRGSTPPFSPADSETPPLAVRRRLCFFFIVRIHYDQYPNPLLECHLAGSASDLSLLTPVPYVLPPALTACAGNKPLLTRLPVAFLPLHSTATFGKFEIFTFRSDLSSFQNRLAPVYPPSWL